MSFLTYDCFVVPTRSCIAHVEHVCEHWSYKYWFDVVIITTSPTLTYCWRGNAWGKCLISGLPVNRWLGQNLSACLCFDHGCNKILHYLDRKHWTLIIIASGHKSRNKELTHPRTHQEFNWAVFPRFYSKSCSRIYPKVYPENLTWGATQEAAQGITTRIYPKKLPN